MRDPRRKSYTGSTVSEARIVSVYDGRRRRRDTRDDGDGSTSRHRLHTAARDVIDATNESKKRARRNFRVANPIFVGESFANRFAKDSRFLRFRPRPSPIFRLRPKKYASPRTSLKSVADARAIRSATRTVEKEMQPRDPRADNRRRAVPDVAIASLRRMACRNAGARRCRVSIRARRRRTRAHRRKNRRAAGNASTKSPDSSKIPW